MVEEKKLSVVHRLEKFAKNFDDGTDHIEGIVVGLALRAGPWVATLPTAYTVFAQTIQFLDWPSWVAAAAGVAVEVLGLSTVRQALKLREYNLTRKRYPPGMTEEEKAKSKMVVDPPAPTLLANTLVAAYFIAAELLVVGLDIGPKMMAGEVLGLVSLAPAVFPLLSLAGTVTLGLRADHRHRLARIAEREIDRKVEKAERKEARKQTELIRKQEKLALEMTGKQAELNRKQTELDRKTAELDRKQVETQLSTLGKAAETYQYYLKNPGKTQADAAEELGTTDRTVRNHLGQLEQVGLVQRENGKVIVTGNGYH